MLNLGAVEEAFKPFLPPNHKLYYDVIVAWVIEASAKKRIFGITPTAFAALSVQRKNDQRGYFVNAMRKRFDDVIFQRRHDCIHNCDRPKVAPQPLTRVGTFETSFETSAFSGSNSMTIWIAISPRF